MGVFTTEIPSKYYWMGEVIKPTLAKFRQPNATAKSCTLTSYTFSLRLARLRRLYKTGSKAVTKCWLVYRPKPCGQTASRLTTLITRTPLTKRYSTDAEGIWMMDLSDIQSWSMCSVFWSWVCSVFRFIRSGRSYFMSSLMAINVMVLMFWTGP